VVFAYRTRSQRPDLCPVLFDQDRPGTLSCRLAGLIIAYPCPTVVSQGTLLLNKPIAVSAVIRTASQRRRGWGGTSAIARESNQLQVVRLTFYSMPAAFTRQRPAQKNTDFSTLDATALDGRPAWLSQPETGADINVYPRIQPARSPHSNHCKYKPLTLAYHHISVARQASSAPRHVVVLRRHESVQHKPLPLRIRRAGVWSNSAATTPYNRPSNTISGGTFIAAVQPRWSSKEVPVFE